MVESEVAFRKEKFSTYGGNYNSFVEKSDEKLPNIILIINEMENFKQVVAYIRHRFPQWDEQSDEVYRFYMAVRRKFNK